MHEAKMRIRLFHEDINAHHDLQGDYVTYSYFAMKHGWVECEIVLKTICKYTKRYFITLSH